MSPCFARCRWRCIGVSSIVDSPGIQAIGVDEVLCLHGKFATRVNEISEGRKRLLYIARERTKRSLRGFFDLLDPSLPITLQLA